MDGIDGNESNTQIVFEVLVGGNVAAPTLQAHLHVELAAFAHGRDVDFLVQNFHIAVRLDHAAGYHARLIGPQVNRLGTFARKLERNLLQIQDDVGRILDYSGNRLELVQDTFDLHCRYGCAFDRTQQHAPQSIPDGRAETAFKGLRPEHSVLVGEAGSVARQPFRFLKTFP